jgi:hypothetical protein
MSRGFWRSNAIAAPVEVPVDDMVGVVGVGGGGDGVLSFSGVSFFVMKTKRDQKLKKFDSSAAPTERKVLCCRYVRRMTVKHRVFISRGCLLFVIVCCLLFVVCCLLFGYESGRILTLRLQKVKILSVS